MYDVACSLVKHLKGNEHRYLLDRMRFALPSFHAYGHNAPCQVKVIHVHCICIAASVVSCYLNATIDR